MAQNMFIEIKRQDGKNLIINSESISEIDESAIYCHIGRIYPITEGEYERLKELLHVEELQNQVTEAVAEVIEEGVEKWLAVDGDGTEWCFDEEPERSIYPEDQVWLTSTDGGKYYQLQKGTIETMIGYQLTWESAPVKKKIRL